MIKIIIIGLGSEIILIKDTFEKQIVYPHLSNKFIHTKYICDVLTECNKTYLD